MHISSCDSGLYRENVFISVPPPAWIVIQLLYVRSEMFGTSSVSIFFTDHIGMSVYRLTIQSLYFPD